MAERYLQSPRPARSCAVLTCCSTMISATSRPDAAGPAWSLVCAMPPANRRVASTAPTCWTTGRAKRHPARRCWARWPADRFGSLRIGDDGHLGIAEGIETALAAQAIFGIPTWAALSADGMRQWQWPQGISARHHLCRCGRRRRAGRRCSRGAAQQRRHRQHDRVAATWRRLQRRSPPWRRRPGLCGFRAGRRRSSRAPSASSKPLVRSLTRPPDLQALGSVLGRLVQARLEPIAGTAGACCDQERDRNFGCDP